MDLKDELIQLLEKAMNSKEHFNPTMIEGVLRGIVDAYGEDVISPELAKWASSMWKIAPLPTDEANADAQLI